MSSTRKISGAFPQTPGTARRHGGGPPTPADTPSPPPHKTSQRSPLPMAPQNAPAAPRTSPVIPLTVLDAPSQRFYALALYGGLWAWKLYDWAALVDDNADSLWLFLKWLLIDLAFLFGLPEMRIPWLELAQPVVITLFFLHAITDGILMFNVPIPWAPWLLSFVKVFYDRGEMAISETYVKTNQILHNSSLIMGKQIINILPEGSATLNPDTAPFCLGGDHKIASIPIYFNATIPIEVELIRTDLNTNEEEHIKLSRSQMREVDRMTRKQAAGDQETAARYDFPVKKPGVYRLGKVLDEYKLEVQRLSSPTFIVPCPSAKIGRAASAQRCHGELSDLWLEVEGSPPLKITYSRTINGKDFRSDTYQSLQPDGFSSPLIGTSRSTSLILPENEDVSWARSQRVKVGLNESVNVVGDWQFSIDEVQDVFGNVVKYGAAADDAEVKPKSKDLTRNLLVKERPRVSLRGCDLRNHLQVAKGGSTHLPVAYKIAGPDTSHSLTWIYSPLESLTRSGEHGDDVVTGSYSAKNAGDNPKIAAPGLYTLKSVSAGSCEGEVEEPASCLLQNPLEPELTLRSEEIPDTCAGNSVGLRVDLDLIGTPPFVVYYDATSNGYTRHEKMTVRGMRYQAELVPPVAGQHKYVFTAISDKVYTKPQPLSGPEMTLEVTVKPMARAVFNAPSRQLTSCLGDEVQVDTRLFGDAPFTLEYELVHDGKRKQLQQADIQEESFSIRTPQLVKGGEYTLALTAIKDKRGCRNFLEEEIKIFVPPQLPRAQFATIDNKHKTMVVEGAKVKLPLRLSGDGPWKVSYRNKDSESGEVVRSSLSSSNDFIEVQKEGTYELVDVRDKQCAGTVDPKAALFQVGWFARPQLNLVDNVSIERDGDMYVKQPVCEGDIDGFDISLKGSPPYHVEYDVHSRPVQGSRSFSSKKFDAALGKASIQMDTSKAGTYEYKFSALSDSLYNTRQKDGSALVVRQTVNAKPSAVFAKPGQTFKYCMTESEQDDKIPIVLTGAAPFSVEIEIKHQVGTVPEVYRIPVIDTHHHGIRIPRHHLRLGIQHIRIREVRDARGCQQKTEQSGSTVQVQLFDAPSIYPMESRTDYCVGERIQYTLSGTPPFSVWYTFDGQQRKASSSTTNFRRIAEQAGEFVITSVSDKASECRAAVQLAKTIHPMPSVRISKGRVVRVDIHEGYEVEIQFDFTGTPPFEFTYTRSTNAKKGVRQVVLETRHDMSMEHHKTVRASQEGTYEVVAIKDAHCAFSTLQTGEGKEGQKKLTY